jgi:pimeloyl-ACP methyl ester carboxylesterase
MAYKEHGVPRQNAKYKIIYVHGFDNCRHQAYVATRLSPELYEQLGLYIVSFDRPGYGESDPHPKRNMQSMALDVEELADQLDLGSKFYVIGYSIAGQYVYSCLQYIPHRLAGASLVSPAVNYWWPSLPANLTNQVYKSHVMLQDKFTLGVAHHLPWLAYWWNTQKWFPSFSVATLDMTVVLSPSDLQILSTIPFTSDYMVELAPVRQQGEYESIHRDLMVGFGRWEVDPMEIKNPFPNKEGWVHLWHGDDDHCIGYFAALCG